MCACAGCEAGDALLSELMSETPGRHEGRQAGRRRWEASEAGPTPMTHMQAGRRRAHRGIVSVQRGPDAGDRSQGACRA